jgi:multidrug efflux pump subunit AcrA (membrane-fusion protein)
MIGAFPPALVIVAALGGAAALLWCVAPASTTRQSACLRVVAPARTGRVAWVVEAHQTIKAGEVVATFEGADGGALLAPVGGAVRAVLKEIGENVAAGEPVVILGPARGTTCP